MNWEPGPKGERGAALILALLIMLVLSGLGMVALQATTDSTWLSATHRVRAQSTSYSDSVLDFGMMRSGDRAASIHQMLQRRTRDDMRGVAGSDSDANLERVGQIRRGGYQIFVKSADPGAGESSLADTLAAAGGSLLDGGVARGAVESMDGLPSDFRFIVRDPVTGPRAPGFSDDFCFIRVTLGSQANVGNAIGAAPAAEDQQRRRFQGTGRHMSDSFIGPISCGSN